MLRGAGASLVGVPETAAVQLARRIHEYTKEGSAATERMMGMAMQQQYQSAMMQ